MSYSTTLFLILIFFSFFIIQHHCIVDLNSREFFASEICSYNGSPSIIQINGINTVQCKCSDEYETDPKIRKINGNEVQCSYKKKRRFTALFYALLLPIGVSDFYLKNYTSFAIILAISILGCCGGGIFLAKEERYHQTQTKQNGKDRDNTWPLFWKWVFSIFYFLFICYWIINFFLVSFGVYKDGNDFEMYNDLFFLGDYFS